MADKNFPPKSERDQRFSDQLLVGAVLALLLVTLVVFRYTSAGSAPLGATTVNRNGVPANGTAANRTPANGTSERNANAPSPREPAQTSDPGMPPS